MIEADITQLEVEKLLHYYNLNKKKWIKFRNKTDNEQKRNLYIDAIELANERIEYFNSIINTINYEGNEI